ncbi:MAG TPA: TRAP transporter small permease subunit [Syntrophorhabdaceae bacterium]|nr:TRAP transporter small permease subunit [Syntrophorhabdaceae bacterium]
MIIERILHRFSGWIESVAGVALIAVMILSGSDVVGRTFGHPIPGAYELISFAGGIVLGFAIPASVIGKVHVIVDIILQKLPEAPKSVLHVISRLMGAGFMFALGYALVKMAGKFRATGDYTAVLQLPFYPVTYAMGGAFVIAGLILIFESVHRGGSNG